MPSTAYRTPASAGASGDCEPVPEVGAVVGRAAVAESAGDDEDLARRGQVRQVGVVHADAAVLRPSRSRSRPANSSALPVCDAHSSSGPVSAGVRGGGLLGPRVHPGQQPVDPQPAPTR